MQISNKGSYLVHEAENPSNEYSSKTGRQLAMRILELRVKNFRSVKDSGDIKDITKIFALIGRNNAGKSSILKAIQILLGKRDIEIDDFHKNTEDAIEVSGVLVKGFGVEKEEIKLKIICNKGDLKSVYYINDVEETKLKFNKVLPELLCIDDIRNQSESQSGGQKTTLLNKILKLQIASENGESILPSRKKLKI